MLFKNCISKGVYDNHWRGALGAHATRRLGFRRHDTGRCGTAALAKCWMRTDAVPEVPEPE